MLRLSLLLLFMVAAASSAPNSAEEPKDCAPPPALTRDDVDAKWIDSAPNTITPPNITDNQIFCSGSRQYLFYKLRDEDDIRILVTDMVCDNGKWRVVGPEASRFPGKDFTVMAASCLEVSRLRKCPRLGAISQEKANAKWPGSAPNEMGHALPSTLHDGRWLCTSSTPNMYYEDKFGAIHHTDQMVCEGGQWYVGIGKYRINTIVNVACLGRTRGKKCAPLKYLSRKEVSTKNPGKVLAEPIIDEEVAYCDARTTPNLLYKAKNEIRSATRLECKNGKWSVAGAKGTFKTTKVYCSS